MKKIRTLLLSLASVAALLFSSFAVAPPAEAATYKWNNTQVRAGTFVRVKYCSNGSISRPHTTGWSTTNDVCGILLHRGYAIVAEVKETGTLLFNRSYCGSAGSVWITFNSDTDTSRTALVYQAHVGC